jgi:hypothetical protein
MNATSPKLISSLTGKEMKTDLVEIAPGEWAPGPVDAMDVPRYGLVWLMRQTDGSYLPVLKMHSLYVSMSHELPSQLGLKGFPARSLYRLISAGFVASTCPTPANIMVDLGSLAQHIEAARDPEFWTPERRARWSTAIAESRRDGTNKRKKAPSEDPA